MQTGAILIPITMFITIGVVLYHFVRTRHNERMAIIEKGLSEEQLQYLLKTRKKANNSIWSIKFGAILIGVGLAILIGAFVPYDDQDMIVTALVFLFPGIALLLTYKFIDQPAESEE